MPSLSNADESKIAVLTQGFDDELLSYLETVDFINAWSAEYMAKLNAALATQREDAAELEDAELEKLRQAFIGRAFLFVESEKTMGRDASTRRVLAASNAPERLRWADRLEEELQETFSTLRALLDAAATRT